MSFLLWALQRKDLRRFAYDNKYLSIWFLYIYLEVRRAGEEGLCGLFIEETDKELLEIKCRFSVSSGFADR